MYSLSKFVEDVRQHERTVLLTVVMLFALVSACFRAYCGVLPHQLAAPVLLQPNLDPTYWLFVGSGAAEWFSCGAGAYGLSALLFLLPLASIYWRKSRISILSAALYNIVLLLYILLFNTYSAIHVSYLYGLWFISLAFLFYERVRFLLIFEGLRYLACWVYASAFLWKLSRGFFMFPLHAKSILRSENAAYLLQNPNTYWAKALIWLIAHEQMAHYLLNMGMLLQSFFIIGFFTKKYDKLLFWLPFLFHFASCWLLDVFFFEFLILQIVFIQQKEKFSTGNIRNEPNI